MVGYIGRELMRRKRECDNGKILFRLMAGWGALLLYLAAGSPLGLGVATLIGTLDTTHDVILASGDHGSRLVLHHGMPCASHKHSTAAKALALFTAPVSPSDPDHVLQFTSVDSLQNRGATPTPASQSDGQLLACTFAQDGSLSLTEASRLLRHPPPNGYRAALHRHSTVLLL